MRFAACMAVSMSVALLAACGTTQKERTTGGAATGAATGAGVGALAGPPGVVVGALIGGAGGRRPERPLPRARSIWASRRGTTRRYASRVHPAIRERRRRRRMLRWSSSTSEACRRLNKAGPSRRNSQRCSVSRLCGRDSTVRKRASPRIIRA